jgi:hypothetical protein
MWSRFTLSKKAGDAWFKNDFYEAKLKCPVKCESETCCANESCFKKDEYWRASESPSEDDDESAIDNDDKGHRNDDDSDDDRESDDDKKHRNDDDKDESKSDTESEDPEFVSPIFQDTDQYRIVCKDCKKGDKCCLKNIGHCGNYIQNMIAGYTFTRSCGKYQKGQWVPNDDTDEFDELRGCSDQQDNGLFDSWQATVQVGDQGVKKFQWGLQNIQGSDGKTYPDWYAPLKSKLNANYDASQVLFSSEECDKSNYGSPCLISYIDCKLKHHLGPFKKGDVVPEIDIDWGTGVFTDNNKFQAIVVWRLLDDCPDSERLDTNPSAKKKLRFE